MDEIIQDLLKLSQISRTEVVRGEVDMTELAKATARDVGATSATIQPLPPARGDTSLLRQVFVNLLSNAVKFTRDQPKAEIEVGSRSGEKGETVYFVRDNGAGFDMAGAAKLFGAFQRLHSKEEFEGTGVGLSTVRRIIESHGGEIWAEASVGKGATFSFTLKPPGQARKEGRLSPRSRS